MSIQYKQYQEREICAGELSESEAGATVEPMWYSAYGSYILYPRKCLQKLHKVSLRKTTEANRAKHMKYRAKISM